MRGIIYLDSFGIILKGGSSDFSGPLFHKSDIILPAVEMTRKFFINSLSIRFASKSLEPDTDAKTNTA